MSNYKNSIISFVAMASFMGAGVALPMTASAENVNHQEYTAENVHLDTTSLSDKLQRYKSDTKYSEAVSLSYANNSDVGDIGSINYLRMVNAVLDSGVSLESLKDLKLGDAKTLNNQMKTVVQCRDQLLPATMPTDMTQLQNLFDNVVDCSKDPNAMTTTHIVGNTKYLTYGFSSNNIHLDPSPLEHKLKRLHDDGNYERNIIRSKTNNPYISSVSNANYIRLMDVVTNSTANLESVKNIRLHGTFAKGSIQELIQCRDAMLPSDMPTTLQELNTVFNQVFTCGIKEAGIVNGAIHLDMRPLAEKLNEYETNGEYRSHVKDHLKNNKRHVGEMSGKNYVRFLDTILKADSGWDNLKDIRDTSYRVLDEFYLKPDDAYSPPYPVAHPDKKERLNLPQDNELKLDNNMQIVFDCKTELLPEQLPASLTGMKKLHSDIIACATNKIDGTKVKTEAAKMAAAQEKRDKLIAERNAYKQAIKKYRTYDFTDKNIHLDPSPLNYKIQRYNREPEYREAINLSYSDNGDVGNMQAKGYIRFTHNILNNDYTMLKDNSTEASFLNKNMDKVKQCRNSTLPDVRPIELEKRAVIYDNIVDCAREAIPHTPVEKLDYEAQDNVATEEVNSIFSQTEENTSSVANLTAKSYGGVHIDFYNEDNLNKEIKAKLWKMKTKPFKLTNRYSRHDSRNTSRHLHGILNYPQKYDANGRTAGISHTINRGIGKVSSENYMYLLKLLSMNEPINGFSEDALKRAVTREVNQDPQLTLRSQTSPEFSQNIGSILNCRNYKNLANIDLMTDCVNDDIYTNLTNAFQSESNKARIFEVKSKEYIIEKMNRARTDNLYMDNLNKISRKLSFGNMSPENTAKLLDAFLNHDKTWEDFAGIKDSGTTKNTYHILNEFYLDHQDASAEKYPGNAVKNIRNGRFFLEQDGKYTIDNNMQILFNCRADIVPDELPNDPVERNNLFNKVLGCVQNKL